MLVVMNEIKTRQNQQHALPTCEKGLKPRDDRKMDAVLDVIAELKKEVGTLRTALEERDQRTIASSFSHASVPVEKENKEDRTKAAKRATWQVPENQKSKTLESRKESKKPKSDQE